MENDDQNTQEQLNITVLLQNGSSYFFKISKKDTVFDLKQLIQQSDEIKIPEGKSINILYLGHILKDTSKFLELEKSNNEFTVNCFFKQQIPEAQLDSSAINQNSEEPHGFDRLRRMNYSRQQITSIRQHFHSIMNSNDLAHEQQIDMEEEWFPALFNETSTDFLSQNRRDDEMPLFEQEVHQQASNLNILAGIFFGILFGAGIFLVIPLFFHEKKILTGIFLGLLLRYASKIMIIYS